MSGWWDDVVWFVGGYPLLKKEPIFHARRSHGLVAYGAGRATISKCGIVLDYYYGGQLLRRSTPSKPRHAWAVGRPCFKCFPEPFEGPGL